MRLLQLTTLLTLGAGSLAILIPPSDSLNNAVYKVKPLPKKAESRPKVNTHGLTPEAYAVAQITQTLEIPCESCPFPTGQKNTYDNSPNNLLLTLTLDPIQRDIINLNGSPMFPAIYAAMDPKPYYVVQKSLRDGREAKAPVDIDLFIETDSNNLSRVRLHVLAVNGWKTMATMEIIEFPIFQNEKGEIFIGEANVRAPTPAEASSIMCKDNLLCRWKAYIYDSLHKLVENVRTAVKGKGCKGKKVGQQAQATEEKPHKEHKGHKQHKGDDEHKDRPHWRWFNWVGLVIRLILACLVIAAITITIGLFFTLIVSTAVHVAVVSWLFIKARACRRKQQKQTVDEEEQGLMSKDEESQLETQEYTDDLPIYSESQEKPQ